MQVATAKSNGFGYKAVIIHHFTLENGAEKTRSEVVSKTLPTKEAAITKAQRIIDARKSHVTQRKW